MSEQTLWHQLFELSWIDFFQGTSVAVEPEKDLSLKQQFVDLVFRRTGPEPLARPLPDGFDDLATHNLVTFKSYQEALDDWALFESVGHFVNYRKQVSPSMQKLLAVEDFRLLAVCARFPRNLEEQGALTRLHAGVYEVRWLSLRIRVIVARELPRAEQNAMLHLFSAQEDLLGYARERYRPRSPETSTLLYRLFLTYSEDPDMSNQLQEFVRKTIDELLEKLPAKERLKGLSPDQRLEGLSPDQRLEGLSPDQRLEGLSPEGLRALMEAAQRRLQINGSPEPPQ